MTPKSVADHITAPSATLPFASRQRGIRWTATRGNTGTTSALLSGMAASGLPVAISIAMQITTPAAAA